MEKDLSIKITIWNEGRHEKLHSNVAQIYPSGIHGAMAEGLKNEDFTIRTGSLDDPDEGLSEEILNDTDVLLWWGHIAHEEVSDGLVNRIQQRVLQGMGLVVLHSGHHSKLFRHLMGTNCNLAWRELPEGDLERVWVIHPAHPIAEGLPPYFEVPQSEMYGEPFDIPVPDELIFVSWFKGGEVFRSGCTFQRGRGRIFFFGPGHEAFPIYHNAYIHRRLVAAMVTDRQNLISADYTDYADFSEGLPPHLLIF